MCKKNRVILAAVLMAMLIVMPVSAGISGPGSSGVQVQNLNLTSSAAVAIELWNQNGSLPIPLASDTLAQGASKNYYLPNYPSSLVPSGNYAMVISSDQAVAAIARTDWTSSGGAAIYSTVSPATDILIPLITANYAGQTSQFSIQNTDATNDATDVSIQLLGRGIGSVKTLPVQTVTKGTSRTYSMTDPIWGALPNTGVDLGVPTGFVGSVLIHSSKGLVVQTFIDVANTRGVSGFSGVPTSSASTHLFCPLIRANYYGDTGISIVNPNGTPVTASITFTADGQSPHKGTFVQNLGTIAGNSSVVPFQGLGGSSRQPPTNLPSGTQTNPAPTNNGFYGVARIDASGPVLAVVNDTKFASNWSVQSQSSYNCAPLSDAGSKFALPLLRRFHTSATKLTTGIQIQNAGNTPITAHLALTNWDGTAQSASTPADVQIPPNGSGNYWNGALTNLPTVPPSYGGFGWFGSGVLTITGGTAVVVVSDEGNGSQAVDSANYNAIKIQ